VEVAKMSDGTITSWSMSSPPGLLRTSYFTDWLGPTADSPRGIMDEVAIYNNTLTAGQVLTHYNAWAGN
jgi:hypothetical protein